jgi:hypothetical protein
VFQQAADGNVDNDHDGDNHDDHANDGGTMG